MVIKHDNMGFLQGEKIDLGKTDKYLKNISEHTGEMAGAMRRNPSGLAPVYAQRKVKPAEVALLTNLHKNNPKMPQRNSNGTFAPRKEAIKPYGRSVSKMVERQALKEAKLAQKRHDDKFSWLKLTRKKEVREKEKTYGLLHKISGKPAGGAQTATGGIFSRGLGDSALAGGGILGGIVKGGKGIGKFLLKNPIGRMLTMGGLLLGANKAFGADGSESDKDAQKQELSKGAGGLVGGSLGWAGGAAAGAAIGSIVPVIGTAVGGLIGAVVGGIGGDMIGESVSKWLYKKDWKGEWDKTRSKLSTSFGWMTGGISGMASVAWTGFSALWPTSAKNIETTFTLLKDNLLAGATKMFDGISQWVKKTVDAVKTTYNGQEVVGANTDGSQTIGQQVGVAVGGAGKSIGDFLGGAGYAMTRKYDNLKYKMGSKNLSNGEIDCSGWNFQVSKMEMEGINKAAGREIFSKEDINELNNGAVEQIGLLAKKNGVVTQAKNGQQLNLDKIKEGMSIGLLSKTSSYAGRSTQVGGNYERMNHIVKVIKDPKTGELMVSESEGGYGVKMTPLSAWAAKNSKKKNNMFAVDPLAKARDISNLSIAAALPNMGAVTAGEAVGSVFGSARDKVRAEFGMNPKHSADKNADVKKQGAKRADAALDFSGGVIKGLSDVETRALMASKQETEANFNTQTVNRSNYLGMYQFGAAALEDLGLLKKGASKSGNSASNNEGNWTISGGKNAFLNNKKLQDEAAVKYANMLLNRGMLAGAVNKGSTSEAKAGYIKAAWLKGNGGANDLVLRGKNSVDGMGTSAQKYYNDGVNAVRFDSKSLSAINFELPSIATPPPIEVPKIEVAQSKKTVQLNSTAPPNAQVSSSAGLAGQDVSDRFLAHVFTGGIGSTRV